MKKQFLRIGLKKWPIIATLMCVATMSARAQAPGTVSVSGNVYHDVTGSNIDGTGTNTGNVLYAVLLNTTGQVVGSSLVAANGTYSIANVPENSTYAMILGGSASSTTPDMPWGSGAVGGWAYTNEGLTPAGEAGQPANGKIMTVPVTTSNLGNVNFALELIPVASYPSPLTFVNPGGTATVNITSRFNGSDPDGTVSQIRITQLFNATSLTIGGTTYLASSWPAAGVTVPYGTTVLLDPADDPITTAGVSFKVIDNLGKESWNEPNITVTVYTVTYMVSGNVYSDANGGTIDGTGTNAGGNLYVVLANAGGTIISASPVAANGTYNISAPAGTYSAILTTSPTSTTPALPLGWVNTNEGLTVAGDGTAADGKIVTVNAADNINTANFGIEQLPTAGTANPTMVNPGGTVTLNLTSFITGTDPDGIIAQIRLTAFPTNTTSFTLGNVTYTPTSWPASGVTISYGTAVSLDPVDGTNAPVVSYKVIDNAGKESTNTGNVTVNLPSSQGNTPDLTPGVDIDDLSFPVAGTPRDFVVNIFEINGATAGNPISVRLSKLSAFTITYPTASGTSDVYGGTVNQNSNWTFTETPGFIIATAKPGIIIPANGSAVLGFSITRKPDIITGTSQTLTTTIVGLSGGEINTGNDKTLTSFTASAN
jgi:hypothetical protein